MPAGKELGMIPIPGADGKPGNADETEKGFEMPLDHILLSPPSAFPAPSGKK